MEDPKRADDAQGVSEEDVECPYSGCTKQDGEYWIGIIGPVVLPQDRSRTDALMRQSLGIGVKLVCGVDTESYIPPYNTWSGWGNTEAKVEAVQQAWAAGERVDGSCMELQRLNKENTELKTALGMILKKLGPQNMHVIDIRDFDIEAGFIEMERDSNYSITYQWVDKNPRRR